MEGKTNNKDIDKNIVYVAQGGNHPALFSNQLLADKMHWNRDISKSIPLKCKAKVRYRDIDHSCQILSSNDDECYIKFDNGSPVFKDLLYKIFTI